MQKPEKSVIISYSMATLAFLIWGTSFTAGKFVSPDPFSPINITFFRTLIGLLTILTIILLTKKFATWWNSFKKHFWQCLLLGGFAYSLGYIIEYWALLRTESSNQAVLSNSMTFWVVLINILIFKQKVGLRFISGLFVALLGILLILLTDNLNFSSVTITGDVGTLTAYLIWGFYSAFSAKLNEKIDPLFTTLSIFLTSLIVLGPISIISGGIQEIKNISITSFLALLFLGIFCSGFAFWIYNKALSNPKVSSENISIFSLINPIIGVFAGIQLLGEIVSLREIIGIILICSAILIANYRPNSRYRSVKDQNNSEIVNIVDKIDGISQNESKISLPENSSTQKLIKNDQ